MLKHLKSYFVVYAFTLVALSIGYVSTWAPMYFKLLAPDEIHLLGRLDQFAVDCAAERDGYECTKMYVIPRSIFPRDLSSISIGLGHIAESPDYGCFDSGKFALRSDAFAIARQYQRLHVFRSAPMSFFADCRENIAVRAFASPNAIRKGFIGGSLFYGSPVFVERVQQFVEFFLVVLLQLLGVAGLILYLVIRSLSTAIPMRKRDNEFFVLIPYFYVAFTLTSGLIGVLLPLESISVISVRSGAVFSCLAMLLMFDYLSRYTASNGFLANSLRLLLRPLLKINNHFLDRLLSPIGIVLIISECSDYGAIIFGLMHLSIGALYIIKVRREPLYNCLTIIYILTTLKLFYTWAPQSNTIFFFVAFVLVHECYLIVTVQLNGLLLKTISDSNERSKMAARIAHDIRSPIGALKMLISQLEWNASNDKLRDGVDQALFRVSKIAKDTLESVRTNNELFRLDPAKLEEDFLVQRRRQFSNIKFRISTDAVSSASFRFSQIEFYRMMGNLLDNACQAEGCSLVVLELRKIEKNRLLIEITNDGKGIPEDILQYLLSHGGTFGKPGGTGLGLTYCRDLAHKYGVDFAIRSKPELTSLRLEFPLLEIG